MRVWALTWPRPLSACETVVTETPAALATSWMPTRFIAPPAFAPQRSARRSERIRWLERRSSGAARPRQRRKAPSPVGNDAFRPSGLGLLERDRGARALELRLGLLGRVLVRALEHRLRGAVDQRLGLTEAERRERADLLDDLDLLVADGLEDDVEGVLLLLLLGGGTGATGCRSGARDGDRRRGGDVERLLELLDEVGQLDERQVLERVEQLVSAELGHGGVPFVRVGWSHPPASSGRGLLRCAAGLRCAPHEAGRHAACFSRRASTVRTAFDSGALNA